MNRISLGKAFQEVMKKQIKAIADQDDTNSGEVKKVLITEQEYDNGMYEDACNHDIIRINQIYQELKSPLTLSLAKIDSGGFEIRTQDAVVKVVRASKTAYYYLEGILYALEENRSKFNVCKRCGAVFIKELSKCPNLKCRTPNWNRETRKYVRRKARLLKIKKKRGVQ